MGYGGVKQGMLWFDSIEIDGGGDVGLSLHIPILAKN